MKNTYIIQFKILLKVCGNVVRIEEKKKYKNTVLTAREIINKALKTKVEVRTLDKNNRSWMMKRTIGQLRNQAYEYHESLWKISKGGKKERIINR